MTFTPRTTTVHGRRLRYLDAAPAGEANRGTLVLLHAFPMNARMWEPQLVLAASGWRIVAPHFRRFGEDGAGDPPATSIDDYAADVVDLLDSLDVGAAVVGGLSMGGYAAFAVLRRAPEIVRALVLADTKPQADPPDAIEGRQKMQRLATESGPSAVVDEMIPKLLGQTTRAGRPALVAEVRALAASSSGDAIVGALAAMMSRPDSTSTLQGLTCPACIIVGAEDTVTPPAIAEEMHGAVPGSQLSVIAAAGHLSNLERPDAFNRAVGRFLNTL